jgi:Integrase core domain
VTDNAMVFTTRVAGGTGGRNALEAELRRRHVEQKNSRPNKPTTCGKVERFQQTLNKWLAAQPDQPSTVAQLQALLEAFTDEYHHRRPHRSLPHRATPATLYRTLPKAQPAPSHHADTHHRVRRDRIDNSGCVTLRVAGRLHHLGIGRTHARTHVVLLVQDLQVRVVDAATGELLRELILDPTTDYQPTGAPKAPPEHEPARTHDRRFGLSPIS